jgi:hypothetical protein
MFHTSAAAGQKNGQSDRKRNYRKENVECRRKEYYRFLFLLIQKTERSDSILHDSAVRYSIFCGSLFSPAASCQSSQFNQKKTTIL